MECEVGVMGDESMIDRVAKAIEAERAYRKTYEDALDTIDSICPCHDKGCPDSDPIVQGELAKALAVARAEEFYVDGQIEAVLEARAFGDFDPRLEP
jgi:hypothetical protein